VATAARCSSRSARTAATTALLLVIVAGAPAVAEAGFVSQDATGTVTVGTAAGEDNRLQIEVTDGVISGTSVAVEELNSPTLTTFDADCTQMNPRRVVCNDSSGHTGMNIALGDQADELTVTNFTLSPVATVVTGGTGNDGLALVNEAGSVEADGGEGNDTIYTETRGGFLEGGDGDDLLEGSRRIRTDTFTGGDGSDTVTYANAENRVAVTVGTGANDGQVGERDYVAGDIERVIGSLFNDTLVGNGAANVLVGLFGDDAMRGGGGADVLDGGDSEGADILDGGTGPDTANYSDRATALHITVGDGPNDGRDAGGGPGSEGDDVQATVERVLGGHNQDVISGSDFPNTLVGGSGNDFLDGGGGDDTLDGGTGADRMFGGDETDTATYAGRTATVLVTIGTGVNDGASGEGDYVASETENVVGGSAGDTLTGNGAANRLDGGGGNDTLDGRGGPDVMIGGAGTGDTVTYASRAVNVIADLDAAVGDDGEDTDGNFSANEGDTIDAGVENLTGGAGDDRLDGNALVNALRGGAGDDRLVGGDGDDIFEGGTGGDLSSGGGGIDTTTYAGRAESVTVVMNAFADDGGASDETGDGGAPDDQVGTENVIGGSRADTLTGDGLPNTITGGPGADTLRGLGNADRLRAKDGGADTVVNCGAGTDVAEADGSDPVVTVGVDACESVI
jgi:Ca2+-binding RTX toxin-like protein